MSKLKEKIIYSKIYPPKLTDNIVLRDYLYSILDAGLTKKLTYISAQSGFGKTTLLIEWINNTNKSIAWINLNENDHNIKSFFKYLIISIQENINPNFGTEAIKELDNNHFDLDKLITLLINDFIFFPNDYLIVIDNFEFINDDKISESINFIIKNIQNNVHFYLLSKNKNQFINYSKLRAENQLNEVESKHLKFNFKDLKEFYKLKSIDISDDNIKLIENKTEGWILSIQLSAFFIKNNMSIDDINNKYIIEYVFEEILNNIDSNILDFLLKTSILPIFNTKLSNYVNEINNSDKIIKYLDKNNLFITTIDNRGEFYRFHKLFSEILLKKMRMNYQDNFEKEIRNKAYEWYIKNDFIIEALEQAFIINSEDKILELLNNLVCNRNDINIGDYAKYLDSLKPEKIIAFPKLCFLYLQYLTYFFKIERTQNIISLIESNKYKISEDLNMYILFSKAYENFLSENIDKSFEYIKLCMDSNKDKKDLFMLSNCYIALSSIYLRRNHYSESLAMMLKGLSTYKKSESLELEMLSDMLFIFIVLNRFNEAEEKCKYIKDRIETIKYSFNYESIKTKYLLSQMNISFYQNKDIKSIIDEIKKFTDKNENPTLLNYIYYSLANISISLRDCSECESYIKNIEIIDNTYSNQDLIFLKARLYLYKNQPEKSYELINNLNTNLDMSLSPDMYLIVIHTFIALKKINNAQRMITDFSINHPEKESLYMIYIYIFNSIIYYIQENESNYINNILQALKLSQKSNILNIFYDFSDELNEIINKILIDFSDYNKQNTNNIINTKYLESILVLFYQKNKNSLKENDLDALTLTKREIELIEMLEQNLTNNEICEKLYLSINTIKTHIKNIYKKLDAKNRKEAILRYKALYNSK
ncbi:MAG: LuxR C-terminal-related transcriptional regulator [Candidatus Sericytochromatia bacterium]